MDPCLECFVCHRNHLVAWVAADITFWVERRDNRKYSLFAGYLDQFSYVGNRAQYRFIELDMATYGVVVGKTNMQHDFQLST